MRRPSKKWQSEKQISSDRVGTRKLRSSPLLGVDGSERAQHPLRPYDGGLQESEKRGNEFVRLRGVEKLAGLGEFGVPSPDVVLSQVPYITPNPPTSQV